MNAQKVRRLVTGHDGDGKSKFIMDGDAGTVLVMEAMGGLAVTDLWETFDAPADNTGAAQERQVFRWVNGRDPRQYGLDFGLWTRKVVAELIAQKFGVTLAVTAVGELLAKLSLTPQKPLQRAYQRDPEAIERWQRETFPAIARQARAEGAAVYFWDESGFRADTVHGKTWGVRGPDPGGPSTGTAPIDQCGLRGHR